MMLLLTGCLVIYNGLSQNRRFPLPDAVQQLGNIPDTHLINQTSRQAKSLIDSHIDSAAGLFQQALLWSLQIRYKEGIAYNQLYTAECARQKGNIPRFIALTRSALPYCSTINQPIYLLLYYKNLVEYYEHTGHIDSAILYCHTALKRIESLPYDDRYDRSSWYFHGRLGSLYIVQHNGGYDDFRRSLHHLYRSRDLAIKHNDKRSLIRSYLSLGAAYANRKPGNRLNNRKGIYYFQQAALLARDVHYDINLGDAYMNLATIYSNENNPDSGMYYVQKAMNIPAFSQYPRSRISAYTLLGVGHYHQGAIHKAEAYLLYAKKESETIQLNSKRAEIEYALYLIYKQQHQVQKALQHLEAFTTFRDSTVTEEKINATALLETKYSTAEQNKQLAQHRLRLRLQQNQIREKNLWIGGSAAALMLLAGFIALLYRNTRQRRRIDADKLRRAQQEQELWKQGEEIGRLNAMIKGEERERARLGNELHDGILSELTVIKISLETIQKRYPEPVLNSDLQTTLIHLDETARQLRKTAHNLMPEILIQGGLVTAVESFCEKTSSLTGIKINFHHNGLLPNLDMDFNLSIYRMVQELVQNSIKHASATETLVLIDFRDPLLMLTVEDNGKGMGSAEDLLSGKGMDNLKARVNALQGSLEIDSQKGDGTSVYIEVDITAIRRPKKSKYKAKV